MSFKHLTTVFLGIGLVVYAAAAQAMVTSPNTYAILVGSRAPSNGVPDALRGDLDVDRVAAQLTWASDVKILKYDWNGPDTVAGDIQAAASSIAAAVKPGDSLIFYYSGHGKGGSGLGVQDFLNPVKDGYYQDNTLAAVFSDSSFASVKKFFMIDSCHSEGIWKNDLPAGDSDLQTLSNISFLASSSEDGVSYADPAGGASYFTNAILPELTPKATFGGLLMSAVAASANPVTGYFKDDGYGTGYWQPFGGWSSDFDLNTQLNGQPVPEPATLILLLVGAMAAFVWRRRIR